MRATHPLDTMRQPQPLTIKVEGDPIDVVSAMNRLRRLFESNGSEVQISDTSLRVYPRAIND